MRKLFISDEIIDDIKNCELKHNGLWVKFKDNKKIEHIDFILNYILHYADVNDTILKNPEFGVDMLEYVRSSYYFSRDHFSGRNVFTSDMSTVDFEMENNSIYYIEALLKGGFELKHRYFIEYENVVGNVDYFRKRSTVYKNSKGNVINGYNTCFYHKIDYATERYIKRENLLRKFIYSK